MRIYLVGYMSAGKSTTSKRLAQRLGFEPYDTDRLFEERFHITASDFFNKYDQPLYRKLETQILQGTASLDNAVIATGGGSILREENRAALGQNAVVVYLQKDLAALAMDGRPLSKDADALKQLYTQRKPIYEAFADCTVAVSDDAQITTERVISCIF